MYMYMYTGRVRAAAAVGLSRDTAPSSLMYGPYSIVKNEEPYVRENMSSDSGSYITLYLSQPNGHCESPLESLFRGSGA